MCARCFVRGNFRSGVGYSDFRKVEISEETIAESRSPSPIKETIKRICSGCKLLCTIAYFACDKYDLTMCARCFVRGNFRSGVGYSDFMRVEISEETIAESTSRTPIKEIVKRICSGCKVLCTIAYFACDKYDLTMCARCFIRGNHRSGVGSSVFRRVEIRDIRDETIAESPSPAPIKETVERICSGCKVLCTIAYFACDKYDLTMCARCFVRGNFRSGVGYSDFRRVEICEETIAESPSPTPIIETVKRI